jgi:hypothetical protein
MNDLYAKAFNNWMDDYVNNPEQFESLTKTTLDHLRARLNGRAPTYGESCAVTFEAYLSQADA